jgi:DNA-binding response OmpR family regulator
MPAKVLVADDDLMLQRLIMNTLKLEQHEVIVANDGKQALDIIRAQKPDLVILDVMMPVLNGFDVCTELRKDPATATLPVIMLSGLGQVQEKITGLRAGADEYLTKPIDPRELLTRVEMLLARHKILRRSAVTKAGRVLSFIGAKGGVGVTTLAVNFAAKLAEEGKQVSLLEFRPDFGTVSVHFNVKPEGSLALLRALEPVAITEPVVSRLLIETPSGVRLLCGPQQVSDFGRYNASLASVLLARLASQCDFIVVDLPPSIDDAAEMIVKSSEQVILVLEPEITSVAAASKRLSQIATCGNTITPRLVTVSRQGAMLLSLREIENRLGQRIADVFPSATDAMSIAIQYGSPIVLSQPNHIYSEHIAELVRQIQENKPAAQHA